MSRWRKSPPWLVELFERLCPLDPRAERRQMFGYPALFVGGHMAAGLFEEALFFRLDAEARAALLQEEGAYPFEPMPGRPLREYVVFPSGKLEDEEAMRATMAQAVAYTLAMPPRSGAAPLDEGGRAQPGARRSGPARRRTR